MSNLWLAGLVLEVGLGAVVLAKKRWAKYPFFSAYSLFNLAATAGLYSIRGKFGSLFYFDAFYAQEAVAVLLGFGVDSHLLMPPVG